uniref:WD_REPEATS_REGION domain-containing protein n=1 Tax=Caenorhabditis tropicalis TaxID=1561998 RepID=A0A1I7U941_9PELO
MSRYRFRKARSNWPMGNDDSRWESPPIHHNELVTSSEPEEPSPVRQEDQPYEGGPLNWKGYMYHPKTKKYFKMTNDPSAPQGFSKLDLDRIESAREAKFQANRPRFTSGSFVKRPVFKPITTLMDDLTLGRCTIGRMERHIHESRLLNCNPIPSFIIKTPIEHYSIGGCEYLDVSENGDRIVGTFSVNQTAVTQKHSAVYVFEVDSIGDTIQSESERREAFELQPIRSRPTSKGFNTLGLTVQPMLNDDGISDRQFQDYAVTRYDSFIVDQTIARIDADVTCMLTVTASDRINRNGSVSSYCTVHLEPLAELSDPEALSTLSCPIYSKCYNNKGNIWSVGWNAPKMSIGFGMESCFRMENLLTERSFVMSSRKRNVLNHCFSGDGNLVFMGLRNDNLIKSDLRMNRDHITGQLNRATNTTFVRVLDKSRPESVLTEGFDSVIRMWDFRWPKKPTMEMQGHRNNCNRLNVFCDKEERFVFAAGSDGYVRGWSLSSGDMLCSIKTPSTQMFPRAVYSDCWGGRPANSALIVAVGDSMRVHSLEL